MREANTRQIQNAVNSKGFVTHIVGLPAALNMNAMLQDIKGEQYTSQ